MEPPCFCFQRKCLCLYWQYPGGIINISCSFSVLLTHQPGQPILSHPPICLHVPRMNKNGATQLLSCLHGRMSIISRSICENLTSKWCLVKCKHLNLISSITFSYYHAVHIVSQRRKGRVLRRSGPSCWYVSQSAPLGSRAPSRSASSPSQPSRGLAWAECPNPQTSLGDYALSAPDRHSKVHRDPTCHEVWPRIQKL